MTAPSGTVQRRRSIVRAGWENGISRPSGKRIRADQLNGACDPVFTNGPHAFATVEADDRVVIEDGVGADEGNEPDVIVLIEVELEDVVVGKAILLCEITKNRRRNA